MRHEDRPTDMLQRQLFANRASVRYRNPETGMRHFCHLPLYREAFLRDILSARKVLKSRGVK